MVKKPKEKLEEMIDFLSQNYVEEGFSFSRVFNEKNRFYMKNKKGVKSGIILLNKAIPIQELKVLFEDNVRDFGSCYSIFYKDYKDFFIRMVDRSSWRVDKSLKRYLPNEINSIIRLTIQERNVLFNFDFSLVSDFSSQHLVGKQLIYYQPKTAKLVPSIRKFNVSPVYFDYSHLDNDHFGFRKARDSISKTYFFLNSI